MQRRLHALNSHLAPAHVGVQRQLSVAITGTSVGIGLEFVKQYAAAGARVYALCRNPRAATDLLAVAAASSGRVTVHQLDQADSASANALRVELAGVPIDVLINNAVSDVLAPPGAWCCVTHLSAR